MIGGRYFGRALAGLLGIGGLVHGAVLYGTLRRNSGWFGPLVTGFEPGGREVWLTIDDGPDPRDTPGILDALARHGAVATFFVVGQRVEAHRDLVRRMAREGHGVGNHTYSHPQATFWTLPPALMRREIRLGAEAVRTALGEWPRDFRSPVGMTNPFVHGALRDVGETLIGWTASGVDGLGARGQVVVDRIMQRVRPGGIIVVHEGGLPGRVETLEMLLGALAAEGYRCVLPGADQYR